MWNMGLQETLPSSKSICCCKCFKSLSQHASRNCRSMTNPQKPKNSCKKTPEICYDHIQYQNLKPTHWLLTSKRNTYFFCNSNPTPPQHPQVFVWICLNIPNAYCRERTGSSPCGGARSGNLSWILGWWCDRRPCVVGSGSSRFKGANAVSSQAEV